MPIRPENRKRYPPNWKDGFERRYYKRVQFADLDGCWVWTGCLSTTGYGRINIGGTIEYAHRVVVHWATGRRVPPGKHVDHLCRNRACVRPSHLEVVNPAENTRRGLAAKLTLSQVRQIRSMRALGAGVQDLAAMFGVHHGHISRIYNNQVYREQHAATRAANARKKLIDDGQQALPLED